MVYETGRAQGVIMTMYALLRDMGIANMVDDDKDGKLGAVTADTVQGLNEIVELWDSDPAQEADGGDDE